MVEGEETSCLKRSCLIPQRYLLGIMCFLAALNGYTVRICLNMAITEIAVPPKPSNKSSYCGSKIGEPPKQVTSIHYNWSQLTQGHVLSSFFLGYLVSHIPGGFIADAYGGKWILVFGMLLNAVCCTIIPPLLIATDGNIPLIISLRIIMGLGQGPLYPAVTNLLAHWTPPDERSFMGSLMFSGAQIGTILAYFLTAILIKSFEEWGCVFYFFGVMGIIWCLLFGLLCHSTPEQSPFIKDSEKEYLKEKLGAAVSHGKKKKTPWKAIFTSGPVWALLIVQWGHDYGLFMMLTDLPKYMSDVLLYDIGKNAALSSAPYAFGWIISLASGFICDFFVKRNCMTLNFARKLFTSISQIGPAVFMMAASYSGCNRDVAVAMFVLSMASMGTFFCGFKVNAVDLSPNFSGMIMAITNGLGATAGYLGPMLVGLLTTSSSVTEWRIAFWICFGVLVVTNFVFVIWGKVEVQPWNEVAEAEPKTE